MNSLVVGKVMGSNLGPKQLALPEKIMQSKSLMRNIDSWFELARI